MTKIILYGNILVDKKKQNKKGVIEMDKLEALEKILKEVNQKTEKIKNNKANKTTEEMKLETYKILKKAINNKLFMVIKLIDETQN